MKEYAVIALRLFFGSQMFFWGLNGFFNWVKIPPSTKMIDNFVQACIQTKFIMPTVKLFEIFFGALLIFGFKVPLALFGLAPIIFVITGLHSFHNPKPWGILLNSTIPYICLLLMYKDEILRIVH